MSSQCLKSPKSSTLQSKPKPLTPFVRTTLASQEQWFEVLRLQEQSLGLKGVGVQGSRVQGYQ